MYQSDPLILKAAACSNVEIFCKLLALGHDPTVVRGDRNVLCMLTIRQFDNHVAEVLKYIHLNAQDRFFNAIDVTGYTGLEHASLHGNHRIVHMLLMHGAQVVTNRIGINAGT